MCLPPNQVKSAFRLAILKLALLAASIRSEQGAGQKIEATPIINSDASHATSALLPLQNLLERHGHLTSLIPDMTRYSDNQSEMKRIVPLRHTYDSKTAYTKIRADA